jgi:hypothetical protein
LAPLEPKAEFKLRTNNSKSFDHSRLLTASETKGHMLLRRTARIALSAQGSGHALQNRGDWSSIAGTTETFLFSITAAPHTPPGLY